MKTLYLTAVLSLAIASSHAATPAIENFQSDSGGTCFELTWPAEFFEPVYFTPSGSDWIVDIQDFGDVIFVLVYPGSSLVCADDILVITIMLSGRDFSGYFDTISCAVEFQVEANPLSDPRRIRVIFGSCPTGEDPGNGEPGDGDADGDGVPDEIDHCPDTPAGENVFGLGCSFAQLIEPVCPCEFDWKNHGDYVSCVSKTADLLLGQGVISEEEKDAIVSIAAESKCGTKK